MTTTARVWLTIAHGGGRWTSAEVREQLRNDNGRTVEQALRWMVDAGHLALYEACAHSKLQRFGVTMDCRIPRGILEWEVLEALGIPQGDDPDDAVPPRGTTVAELLRRAAAREQEAA